jgi:sugar lactone lactonase YvrE
MALPHAVTSLLSAATLVTVSLVSQQASAAHFPPASELELIASFDTAAGETPEDVYVDPFGNKFISLAEKGEIRKIDAQGRQSTYATLPVGGPRATFCSGFYGISGPITFDPLGNLYVSLASCTPEARGVWKVSPNRTVTQLTRLPGDSFPNGILYRLGKLYIADSNLGLIWKMSALGGPASVWVEDELLLRNVPGQGFTGANGLQYFGGEIYTAVTDKQTIVSIPLMPNGTAGEPQVYAETPVGIDDFAFDAFGNIYGASFFNQVLRVKPNGQSEVVVAGGILDGPTSIAFGRTFGDFFDIYITSAAFTGFSATSKPNLARFRVGVPGTFLFPLLARVTHEVVWSFF